VRISELSFRSGKKAVAKHPEILASIFAAIVNAQEAQLKKPRISIEKHLQRELLEESWTKSKKNPSFLNGHVAVHTEFSRYELVYRDIFQLLAAYNEGRIDASVIITNTMVGSRRVKHRLNESHFERVCKELERLYPSFPVPIWVIGLR